MKFFSFFFFLLTINAYAQPLESTTAKQVKNSKSTEQRMIEIERRQREFDDWYSDYYVLSKGRVTPFLGEKISFGGFFEMGMTHLAGPDTESQTSANTNLLGINIAAEFNENIRFVTQVLTALGYNLVNPHNNPNLTPARREFGPVLNATLVAHAYLELRQSDSFIVQTGIGYVPFGISFQEREPVLFKRRNGPQMLQAGDADSVGLAFPLWIGVHLHGAFSLERSRWGYNLYTFSPATKAKSIGGGARAWWSNSESVTVGISAQGGEQKQSYFSAYGADLNFKLGAYGFLLEYARNAITGPESDLISYYFEPYVDFSNGEWILFGVGDYVMSPDNALGLVNDPFERWQYGAGVNWLPLPNARFRLALLAFDYVGDSDEIGGQKRDYYSVDFSTGIAF